MDAYLDMPFHVMILIKFTVGLVSLWYVEYQSFVSLGYVDGGRSSEEKIIYFYTLFSIKINMYFSR